MERIPTGNVPRLRRLLEESEFDAVIAVSPESFTFSSGCSVWTQTSIRERLAFAVWVKGEPSPVVIVCEVEEPLVRAESWVEDIRTYVEFCQSPVERLIEVLMEKGVSDGRLGIEMKCLSAADFHDLAHRAPKARFLSGDEMFASARMIKTYSEIELLRTAARATEKALLATYATVEPGETEKSMANRLSANLLQCGLDRLSFVFIGAGSNTCLSHRAPSEYRARLGEIVRADVGGTHKSYCSDVARTAVIGQPSPEQGSLFGHIVDIHAEVIEMARPGNRACDLYNKAKEAHARRRIPLASPHTGHGLGLQVHEEPFLTAFNTVELVPNMVICVETRYRVDHTEFQHIEDLILVTEEGPKVLTTYFNSGELYII